MIMDFMTFLHYALIKLVIGKTPVMANCKVRNGVEFIDMARGYIYNNHFMTRADMEAD